MFAYTKRTKPHTICKYGFVMCFFNSIYSFVVYLKTSDDVFGVGFLLQMSDS